MALNANREWESRRLGFSSATSTSALRTSIRPSAISRHQRGTHIIETESGMKGEGGRVNDGLAGLFMGRALFSTAFSVAVLWVNVELSRAGKSIKYTDFTPDGQTVLLRPSWNTVKDVFKESRHYLNTEFNTSTFIYV